MVFGGFYIIEYNYKDRRGAIRTKRLMRGNFELVVEVYKDLKKLLKNKDIHRPIKRPRLIKLKEGIEEEIDFKEEFNEWKNFKNSIKSN